MNMSYCRFQNTLSDVKDCFDHLHDDLQDKDERDAREKLIEWARSIVDEAERYGLGAETKECGACGNEFKQGTPCDCGGSCEVCGEEFVDGRCACEGEIGNPI